MSLDSRHVDPLLDPLTSRSFTSCLRLDFSADDRSSLSISPLVTNQIELKAKSSIEIQKISLLPSTMDSMQTIVECEIEAVDKGRIFCCNLVLIAPTITEIVAMAITHCAGSGSHGTEVLRPPPALGSSIKTGPVCIATLIQSPFGFQLPIETGRNTEAPIKITMIEESPPTH